MPAATYPRPYDPVEEAAAAMGVANLRPRYFISGSPDATIGLNAKYGQAVEQASELGMRLATAPLKLEQERLQTDSMGMSNELLGVKTDRVRNALANRPRIEAILSGEGGIDPKAPDYRARRRELAALGADEILGEELNQLDREAEPYDRVRNELAQRDEIEKSMAPKRTAVLAELGQLDPKDPEFRKKTFGIITKYPEALQDRALYTAIEDISRTGAEFEMSRKLRDREVRDLDPTSRRMYEEKIKADPAADPDTVLYEAKRSSAARQLGREALSLGIPERVALAAAKDGDIDALSDLIARRRGEINSQRIGMSATRSQIATLNAKMRTLDQDLESDDEAVKKAAIARYRELRAEMDALGAGGTGDPDEPPM